jgi:hypothetical protein
MTDEEIIKDDIAALIEEQATFHAEYLYDSPAIQTQIDLRVRAAKQQGIEV